MARPLRFEHPGALWHVTSRGNERGAIFCDDHDRIDFLEILADSVDRFGWRLHAYVLMGNHYHLLLETPEPSLSRGIHRLNGVYSQRFNRRHQRAGHLLEGRFKAILVEKERHLLELVRYVVLNPVRAGMTRTAADWPWSSYPYTAGLRDAPAWLETHWTVAQFGSGTGALEAYREFVSAGAGSLVQPWRSLTSQLFLGSEAFRAGLLERMQSGRMSSEFPREQRRPARPSIAEVIAASAQVLGIEISDVSKSRRSPLRLAVAYVVRRDTLTTLADLGLALGVSTSSACEIYASANRLRLSEASFRALIASVRAEIRKMKT